LGAVRLEYVYFHIDFLSKTAAPCPASFEAEHFNKLDSDVFEEERVLKDKGNCCSQMSMVTYD
jgi:hypothetical protein